MAIREKLKVTLGIRILPIDAVYEQYVDGYNEAEAYDYSERGAAPDSQAARPFTRSVAFLADRTMSQGDYRRAKSVLRCALARWVSSGGA